MLPDVSSEPDSKLIDQEKSTPNKKVDTLSAVTFNIEGITSNRMYLDILSKRTDIIMLQEHWLHSYDKYKLGECMKDFVCFSKCFDEETLSEPTERHRGHAGVAICVRKKYEQFVEYIPDGGNRIIGIKLKCNTPLIFLCVYMPCRGNGHTTDDYQQILDEISEIMVKYGDTYKFILGGDMNASFRRDSTQDNIFKRFVQDHELLLSKKCKYGFTFYHYNGRDASQIDYFLQSDELISDYIVFDREAHNTSTHNPVLVHITCDLDSISEKCEHTPVPRVRWDKIDKISYRQKVELSLHSHDVEIDNLSSENLSHCIKTVCDILSQATSELDTPRNQKKRRFCNNKKLPWTPVLEKLSKDSKCAHAQWKAAGKPSEPDNPLHKNKISAKKAFRSEQRKLEASLRNEKYRHIMELNETNDKDFYKLIRKQREHSESASTAITFDGTIETSNEKIKSGWAQYFEELATPIKNQNFDENYFINTTLDVQNISNMFRTQSISQIPIFTEETVRKTIRSFKNGKSADEDCITVEHLKYGGDTLISILTTVINFIFQNIDIPTFLKSGIATPVLKKGKPKSDPNSYRKITVTNLIGKVVEKLHLQYNEESVLKQQSALQKGFTKGQMPLITALILTELILEANKTKSCLYVALMDAKKAFDVLWHTGLLRQMFNFGIEGNNWLFFEEWYKNVTSKIKWNGSLSRPIQEQQGVRQGGVWSPSAYKIFIDRLLELFQTNQLGAYIGSTYCGIPTVADDVTLISNCQFELQTMLDVQADYANKQRYLLSEQKSTILSFNDGNEHHWSINNKELKTSESAVHLGITRDSKSSTGTKKVVGERIVTARKTVYALMGAGLHGLNGVNPSVSSHLIKIYVLPRLIYGLDVIKLTATDLKNLDAYYLKLLKQIQHFPQRTANSATYLLLGKIPVSGEIDKKILKTFGNIVRNDNSVEKDIALRQLAMKSNCSESWFPKVVEIAQRYDLPSPYDLIFSPPEKETWKKIVNETVNKYHIQKLLEESHGKSTLQYLNLSDTVFGVVHNIWSSCGTQPFSVVMATLKAKIAVGALILQSNRSKFAADRTVLPICQLCMKEPEDAVHFLLLCGELMNVRNFYLQKMKEFLLENHDAEIVNEIFQNTQNTMKLIVDCSVFHFLKKIEMMRIETISRGLCYKLTQVRLNKLSNK